MNRRVIIIGSNNLQIWPVYNDYASENDVEIVNLDSNKKDATSGNFLLSLCQSIEFGRLARNSFSYRHSVRYFDKSMLLSFKRFLSYFLGRFSEKYPEPARFLCRIFLKILEIGYLRDTLRIRADDVVVFCALMQTDTEYRYFAAATKVGAQRVYYPGNWDNPSSKLGLSYGVFDLGYAWTSEMSYLMKKTQKFKEVLFKPNNRLSYIKEHKTPQTKHVKILIALSQKSGSGLNNFLNAIKKQLLKYPDVVCVVRLHPYNSRILLDFEESNQLKIDRPNPNLVNALSFADSYNAYQKYDKFYIDLMTNSSVIITEGGTIGLEGHNLCRPVIILSIERNNRTALLFNHFDHYRLLSSAENCIAMYDDMYLIDRAVQLALNPTIEPLPELALKFQGS